MNERDRELYVSVDIETSGPIPGEYSMLSIGACLISDPALTFYCELKPITDKTDQDALAVSGFSLGDLQRSGLKPEAAMASFREWLNAIAGADGTAVFVGFNAPFDWSFVNYYFHRFGGENPFGFTALDIKALYMGKTGSTWADTRSSRIAERLRPNTRGDHNALQDAIFQAELFRLVQSI